MRVLDDLDDAVYVEAFRLAEAVRRLLARERTRRVLDAGLLDPDVVQDLIDADARMCQARLDRVRGERVP
jgi:hypothetical protein